MGGPTPSPAALSLVSGAALPRLRQGSLGTRPAAGTCSHPDKGPRATRWARREPHAQYESLRRVSCCGGSAQGLGRAQHPWVLPWGPPPSPPAPAGLSGEETLVLVVKSPLESWGVEAARKAARSPGMDTAPQGWPLWDTRPLAAPSRGAGVNWGTWHCSLGPQKAARQSCCCWAGEGGGDMVLGHPPARHGSSYPIPAPFPRCHQHPHGPRRRLSPGNGTAQPPQLAEPIDTSVAAGTEEWPPWTPWHRCPGSGSRHRECQGEELLNGEQSVGQQSRVSHPQHWGQAGADPAGATLGPQPPASCHRG